MKAPSLSCARLVLFGIFGVGALVQGLCLGQVSHEMRPSELQELITQFLGIYGVHIAVMTGGIFAQNTPKRQRVLAATFGVAVFLAVAWNVLMGAITCMFVTSDMTVGVFSDQIAKVSSASSFLVAGALAYFFTNPVGKESASSSQDAVTPSAGKLPGDKKPARSQRSRGGK